MNLPIEENNCFLNQLIQSLLNTVQNKINHLEQRKKKLEENMEDAETLFSEERLKAKFQHEEILNLINMDRKLELTFKEIITDLINYRRDQLLKEAQANEDAIKKKFQMGFEYMNIIQSILTDPGSHNISKNDFEMIESFEKILKFDKSLRKTKFTEHLYNLVSNKPDKIHSIDSGELKNSSTYSELKIILDKVILSHMNQTAVSAIRHIKENSTHNSIKNVNDEAIRLLIGNNKLTSLNKRKNLSQEEFSRPEEEEKEKKLKKNIESIDFNATNDTENQHDALKKLILKKESNIGSETNDIFYQNINLSRLSINSPNLENGKVTTVEYAYSLAKILFSKQELQIGVFPDEHGKSRSVARINLDPEKIKILKKALGSTKFACKTKDEWEKLRIALNKRIRNIKQVKHKSIICSEKSVL